MSLSHFSFIDARLPGWLKSATPAQRQRLEQQIRQSHQATRALDRALKQVQPIDDFCRPLLDDAMSHWYPDRELPAPDQGWLWNNAEKRDMSWLEAALQNFDSDTSVTLYLSRTPRPDGRGQHIVRERRPEPGPGTTLPQSSGRTCRYPSVSQPGTSAGSHSLRSRYDNGRAAKASR